MFPTLTPFTQYNPSIRCAMRILIESLNQQTRPAFSIMHVSYEAARGQAAPAPVHSSALHSATAAGSAPPPPPPPRASRCDCTHEVISKRLAVSAVERSSSEPVLAYQSSSQLAAAVAATATQVHARGGGGGSSPTAGPRGEFDGGGPPPRPPRAAPTARRSTPP